MSGFQAIRSQGGGDNTGQIDTYDVASTHSTRLAIGDVVDLTGTADATGRAGCDAAGTTGQILGVIVGFEADPDNLTDTGLAASTGGKARVNIDPNANYVVDVANGPLVVADVGLNVNQVVTEATRSGGMTSSNMTVNATGVASTVTFPWRVVGLLEDSAGVLGNKAIVRPNSTTLNAGTVGA